MADKKPHTTEIVVTEQKVIHKGRNNNSGRDYTIYQVIATNRNGQLIDLNLRSFSELPKNQAIKVEVEKFVSEQYGVSYTVSLEGKRKNNGLGKEVNELKSKVAALERRIEELEQRAQRGPAAAPPAATPPPRSPDPAPPPIQTPPSDGAPSDDIPF